MMEISKHFDMSHHDLWRGVVGPIFKKAFIYPIVHLFILKLDRIVSHSPLSSHHKMFPHDNVYYYKIPKDNARRPRFQL